MRRVVTMAALIASLPAQAQADGPVAEVAAAVAHQDLNTLDRLTGGKYRFEFPPYEGNGKEVVALLRGCSAEKVFDGPNKWRPDEHGMIFWVCSGQLSAADKCRDVGYIGTIKGTSEPYFLDLERSDNWVAARCGPVHIPASPAPRSPERGN